MRRHPLSLRVHMPLLLLFSAGMACLWLLPVFMVGYPYQFPDLLVARNEALTHLFSQADALGRVLSTSLLPTLGKPFAFDGRLSAMVFSQFFRWFSPADILSWTALGAGIFSLSLVAWWFLVRRLFDARIAWCATLLLACIPMFWLQALTFNLYILSIPLLLASFATFAWVYPRSPLLGMLASGLLFGCAVSAKDVFLIFLPWMVLSYCWIGRKHWHKTSLLALLFLACAGAVYLAPYVGDIRQYGYPVNQNLARLWPGGKKLSEENYLELYRDPYTFVFDRKYFDGQILEQYSHSSFLERMVRAKLLFNFHLRPFSLWQSLGNGCWLMLTSIPPFFQMNTVGGVIVWLFAIPGIAILWQRHRRLLWLSAGLVLSSYLAVRFVLHYDRDHLINVIWLLALFAAVGICGIVDALAAPLRRHPLLLSAGITLLLALQLAQATRAEIGRLYVKSDVPDTLALAQELRSTPASTVVALALHPTAIEQTAFLSDRTLALFVPDTLERLLASGTLKQAFDRYGVTLIALYEPDLSAKLKAADPSLTVLPTPVASPPNPSFLGRFLLSVFH